MKVVVLWAHVHVYSFLYFNYMNTTYLIHCGEGRFVFYGLLLLI